MIEVKGFRKDAGARQPTRFLLDFGSRLSDMSDALKTVACLIETGDMDADEIIITRCEKLKGGANA